MDEHLFRAGRRGATRQSADSHDKPGSLIELYSRCKAIRKWTSEAVRRVGLQVNDCCHSGSRLADNFDLQLRRGHLAVSVVRFVVGQIGPLSHDERKWVRKFVDIACDSHDGGSFLLSKEGA
jgi:hypothetical protein